MFADKLKRLVLSCMALMALGGLSATAQTEHFEGTWITSSPWGELRLVQNGDTVQGDLGDKGIIWGKVKGKTLRANFTLTDASGSVPVTGVQQRYGFVEFYKSGGFMAGRSKWGGIPDTSRASVRTDWVADRISTSSPTLTHTGSPFARPGTTASMNWVPLASQQELNWVSYRTSPNSAWPMIRVPGSNGTPLDKDFPDINSSQRGTWTGTYQIDNQTVYLRQAGDWVWGRKGSNVILLGHANGNDLRGMFNMVDSSTGLTHSYTKWGMFEMKLVNGRVLGNWKWRAKPTNSSRDGLWAGQQTMTAQPQLPDPNSLGPKAVFPSRMTEEDYYWMTFEGAARRASAATTLPGTGGETLRPVSNRVSSPDTIRLTVTDYDMSQSGGLERNTEFAGAIYVDAKAGNSAIPDNTGKSRTLFHRTTQNTRFRGPSLGVAPPSGRQHQVWSYKLPPSVKSGSAPFSIEFDISVSEKDRLRANNDKCAGVLKEFPSGAPWWTDRSKTYSDTATLICPNGIKVEIDYRLAHAS